MQEINEALGQGFGGEMDESEFEDEFAALEEELLDEQLIEISGPAVGLPDAPLPDVPLPAAAAPAPAVANEEEDEFAAVRHNPCTHSTQNKQVNGGGRSGEHSGLNMHARCAAAAGSVHGYVMGGWATRTSHHFAVSV
jgi:hypothetical protein